MIGGARRPGAAERAAFYTRLGTLYEAGVPLERALRVSGGEGSAAFAGAAESAARAVAAGQDLVAAGSRAGLFGERDASVLRAGSGGGRLGAMLLRLGEWYRLQAEHAGTVKRQLALPVFVVVVVILLGPLPALALGRIGVTGYLARTLVPLALAALLWRLWSVVRQRHGCSGGQRGHALDGVLLRLPVLGAHLARREVVRWLAAMALLQEAGVPVVEAARLARDTVGMRPVWRAFDRAARRLPEGESLELALDGNPFLEPQMRYLLASGEQSGCLAEMLWRASTAGEDRVEAFERAAATWAPRLLYFLVLLWLAWGLIRNARNLAPSL